MLEFWLLQPNRLIHFLCKLVQMKNTKNISHMFWLTSKTKASLAETEQHELQETIYLEMVHCKASIIIVFTTPI